jgi:NAD(P)-dependent dehydrogenase (short-subunit alcohol dehydrogenase family)
VKLAGKVAVVTGGARGLGRAYVLRLASLGADVVVNDVNLDAAREFGESLSAPTVLDEVRALDRRAVGFEADISVKANADALVETTLAEFGRIDVLVNNAGGHLRPGPALASTMSEDDYRFILDINLTTAVFCCQAAAVPMKDQRSGKIINVGSLAGLRATSGGGAHYGIAKAAIQHYTRQLAAELGPFGVNVNCIAPGWILSSRAIAGGRNSPGTREKLESEIALRRLGWPEDCAKIVEFLATDLSDYVTGQTISIDGGVALF